MEKTNFTFVFPSKWMKAFGLMLLAVCWMGLNTASADDCGGELVCGGQLNTNLQDGCEATLTAASAVPGFDCEVTIVVEDGVGADNVIQGCGTYKYVVTDVDEQVDVQCHAYGFACLQLVAQSLAVSLTYKCGGNVDQ